MNNSIQPTQKYSWLTAGTTFPQMEVIPHDNKSDSDTDKEDNKSSESNEEIMEIDTIQQHSTNSVIKFSFDTFNRIKSRRKQAKYIKQYYLDKIYINEDVNSLSFSFYPLGNKSYYTYKQLQLKEIPRYHRLNTNHIIGIKNIKVSRAILYQLNQMTNQDNITKHDLIKDNEDDIGNEIHFLRKKRYYSDKSNHYKNDVIKFDLSKKEVEVLTNLKNNESNPQCWIEYIKNNLTKDLERLNMIIFTRLNRITFSKESILLTTFQLRFYDEINLSPPKVSIFALNILKRKTFDNPNDKSLFLHEYLTYIKRQSNLNIQSIRDIYLILCQIYQLQEKEYLSIVFDYIYFEWQREYHSLGMSIITSLIELSVLYKKKIAYVDYENYFNSDYPKIGELSQGAGYAILKTQPIKLSNDLFHNSKDYIDHYQSNNINYRKVKFGYDTNVNYNDYSANKDIIFYSDICDFIFPIKDIGNLINQIWLLMSQNDPTSFNSLCSYTKKYMIEMNSQLYEYLIRLCKFIIMSDIDHDDIDHVEHFYLNIIFSYKDNSIEEKLSLAKEIFKREHNQNNIPLYVSFMFWMMYYGKVTIADSIMNNILIKKKKDINESAYVDNIHLQYNIIKTVTGLVSIKETEHIFHNKNHSQDPVSSYDYLIEFIGRLWNWTIEDNTCQYCHDVITKESNKDRKSHYIYYGILLLEYNSMKHNYSFNYIKAFYIELHKKIKQTPYAIDIIVNQIFIRNHIRFLTKFTYDINYIHYIPYLDYWDIARIISKCKTNSRNNNEELISLYIKYDSIAYHNYLSFNLIPYSDYIISYTSFINQFIEDCHKYTKFNDCFIYLLKRIPYNLTLYHKAEYLLNNHLNNTNNINKL